MYPSEEVRLSEEYENIPDGEECGCEGETHEAHCDYFVEIPCTCQGLQHRDDCPNWVLPY